MNDTANQDYYKMADYLIGIRNAMISLGITGDLLFKRIREDLERGLIDDARVQLNFVDKIIQQQEETTTPTPE